jgi:hypothetical protein
MADRQCGELFHAPDVEVTDADEDCADAVLRKSCEGRFEIAIGSAIHNDHCYAAAGEIGS